MDVKEATMARLAEILRIFLSEDVNSPHDFHRKLHAQDMWQEARRLGLLDMLCLRLTQRRQQQKASDGERASNPILSINFVPLAEQTSRRVPWITRALAWDLSGCMGRAADAFQRAREEGSLDRTEFNLGNEDFDAVLESNL